MRCSTIATIIAIVLLGLSLLFTAIAIGVPVITGEGEAPSYDGFYITLTFWSVTYRLDSMYVQTAVPDFTCSELRYSLQAAAGCALTAALICAGSIISCACSFPCEEKRRRVVFLATEGLLALNASLLIAVIACIVAVFSSDFCGMWVYPRVHDLYYGAGFGLFVTALVLTVASAAVLLVAILKRDPVPDCEDAATCDGKPTPAVVPTFQGNRSTLPISVDEAKAGKPLSPSATSPCETETVNPRA